ncbi:LLM class flavin-dependent oxidoreductase [Streptomyces sp. NPDC091292]|uniref:LLM class flavin-dependent oxidoreductase n=1 Tax=Streptomyces sp. NPDC091292 TaxID=3365991 RepID=UPI0037FD9AAA
MPDYGHDLLFGAVLMPSAGQPLDAVAMAQLGEQAGLDLMSVPDHPYQPGFLDAWTVLGFIAAATSRVRVFPNVANLPLRPPAALARTAASLDLLSGGRVELGLGAGAYWDNIAAEGGPRRTPGEAVAATREAIDVVRALWAPGRRVRLDGKHYGLYGAAPGPVPAHDIGIWIGAVGPRMLRLVGTAGDGWLPSVPHVPPVRLAAGHRIIDEAAAEAGRPPGAVRRLYNLSPGAGGGFPEGSPGDWPEQLAALALEHGTSAFLLPANFPDLLQVFGEEVAPATRELVAAERSGGSGPETPRGERETVRAAAGHGKGAGTDKAAAVSTGAGAGPSAGGDGSGGRRLSVEPTPDPGLRRSSVRLWEESDRPSGPPADPQRRYSRRQEEPARNLVAAHDQLRADLTRLREVVDQVLAESLDPGEARAQLQELSLRQNTWALGAYCASYCRITTAHHSREDVDLFPHLRRLDERLGPVLDRLTEEHHAIHGVIEQLDRELVAAVSDEGGALGRMEGLRAAVDLLTDALLSHLAYEERELIEPMARFGTGW